MNSPSKSPSNSPSKSPLADHPDEPAPAVLALDFDGVIWDSVDEAFEQGWHAWADLHGRPGHDRDDLRSRFRAARWQCKDGHDFYLVMRLLSLAHPPDVARMPPEQFRRLREEQARGPDAEQFVEAFYGRREFMRQEHFSDWLAVQRAYPGIVEQVRALRERLRGVAIATTKDAPSARALLASVDLGDLPVFGREVSLDKRDHMKAIAERFAVRLDRVLFIDDLLENLKPLAPMGVLLGLAGWGYNTPAEQAVARREDVPVLSIEGFADQVLDILGMPTGPTGKEFRPFSPSPPLA